MAQSYRLARPSPLSLDTAVDTLGSVNFNLRDNRLANMTISTIPMTSSPMADDYALPMEPPVHDFVLYLPSTPNDEYPLDRLVYHSDRGFTPYDILGAIYTYYQMPIPQPVLERMAEDEIAAAIDILSNFIVGRPQTKRIDLMGDRVQFAGLMPDESGEGYTIDLTYNLDRLYNPHHSHPA
jgi:hypothetical protein